MITGRVISDFQKLHLPAPFTEESHYSHFTAPVVEKIVGFDVSVNDTKLVDVSQGLQQVIDVQPHLFKAQCANDVLLN